MPSAASAKLEKQASGNQTESSSSADNNNSSNNNANTPIRQALVIIEHKIRNLEKRKTKLESYRAIQSSGKELSNDQKIAVSKFDEVAQSLEFARDLSKQMLQLATNAEKEQKRQSRKETALRTQAEIIKIREVLTIQDILSNFSLHSQIRDDFLNGTNGAVKLEEDDLQILEKFYADIQVKRQITPEDASFMTIVQKAAEYLSLTIDGRPKQYGETTFENIRRILNNIQECGYLDRYGKISEGATDDISGGEIGDEESPEDDEQNDEETETDETEKVLKLDKPVNDDAEKITVENVSSNISEQSQQQLPHPTEKQQQSVPSPITIPQNIGQQTIDVPKFVTEAPSAAAVPAPSFPQQPSQQQQSPQQQSTIVSTQGPPPQISISIVPTQMVASVSVAQTSQIAQGPPTIVQPNPAAGNPIHFPPTTVRAVEQAYFKQHQYIAQMRPLAEVIGSGNFFFLQDSELDSPDIVPAVGFPSNDGQNQGNTSVPISNSTTGLPNQSNLPQQGTQTQSQQHQQQQQQQQPQQPQLPIMPQSGGMTQQQKSQQGQPNAAPIPTQTFTNQSFPPIVPPSAIFQPQGIQNPNEIPSSQNQMPVFTGPPLPIPQMVVAPGAVQQQSIVVSIAPSSVTSNTSQNSGATVLKTVENQQQQGIITNQQPSLIAGPGGASVPLPGFTSSVITIGGLVTYSKPQENYEKLQKSVQGKNVLNENQIHHKKVDDVVVKERLSENPNDWDSNENLPKPQRVIKKEEESNQWSNEVANNVKTNEWSNSNYDNQTVETNNWNSNSNQNDNVGGYGSRTRNNFGNRSGGGNRGIRNSVGGAGGGNVTNTGGPPPNGYRGGRPSNSYQQQQNNRNSGMYFRNNNDNTTGGGSGGYYQSHQNGGYNSGGVGKQDGTNNTSGYGGSGSMNTGYRPRGGPISSSNRQQNSGVGGVNSRGADGSGSNRSGGSSNPGGPQPQRNMNSNRPPNSGGGGGGMSTNSNRSSGGGGGGVPRTTGNYRPPNIRNQHQHQQHQDVNV